MIHDDYIDETTGLVTDGPDTPEVYYSEAKAVFDGRPGSNYIRVQCNAGEYDIETRIHFKDLEALGWKKL